MATLFLSPSILPSFLAYKIPIFYSYPIILWAIVFGLTKKWDLIIAISIGIIAFFPAAQSFYVDFVPANIFQKELILDYGNDELSVAIWLKKNTAYQEKIMNLGNSYIDVLAERLPQNRYVYIFPWLVLPYENSTKEILSNPPKVVIIDNNVLEGWPILKEKWRFIYEVKKNYRLNATYGTYEIYTSSN